MKLNVIKKALESRESDLKKIRVQVCNSYCAYTHSVEVCCANSIYLQSKEEEEIQYDHLYVGLDTAVSILSDIEMNIKEEQITKYFYSEVDELCLLYPYSEIFKCFKELSNIDFFIGILSSIINIYDDHKLGIFYKKKILPFLKDMGFEDIYKLAFNNKSVFVAMWFDESMNSARRKIENAVKECGYDPVLIDQKEHNNQIVPEIFYEIKESSFVIADLTGQRSGVYYEAGYAEALGKKVILTCKDSEKPHFDVAQKNTIFWDTEEDLYKRLLARIKSTCII